MKKVLLLVILCAYISTHCYSQSPVTYKGRRIYPTKAADNTIGLNGSLKYNAGDTIVLTAAQNPYSWASFTALNNVTIINEGGQVVLNWVNNGAIPGGFLFQNCTHITLTGTGVPGVKYGFKITTPANRGVGVTVYDRSAWFEIDHCEMYNKASGFWIKEEVQCADSLSFPNWVLHDFKLHDNYIHNCSLEGMYLGSTDPNNESGTSASQHPVVYCNGVATTNKPMRLGNFKIYNNIIDSTGRGAIQLSDADQGENEIYNNKITNIGYEFNGYQGNGIILGGYTHANVHDNFIDYTYSTGIFSLGAGLVKIVNNTVDHSGTLAGLTESGVPNIMVDTRNTTVPSPGKANPVMLTFKVKGNILGANTDYGVRVYSTFFTYTTNNAVCDNKTPAGGDATHYVATGIYWKSECDTGRLNTSGYVTQHATAATLNTGSAASIYPNPAKDVLNINLDEKIVGKIRLNINDEQGRTLQTKDFNKSIGQTQQSFNIKSLLPGLYNLQINTATDKINLRFIKTGE